jgi:hypothetical protein
MNPPTANEDEDDGTDSDDTQPQLTAEEMQAAREAEEERARVAKIEREKAVRQKVIDQLKLFSRSRAGTDSDLFADLETNDVDEDDEGYDYNEDEGQMDDVGSKRKSRATKPKDTSAVGQYLLQFNRRANEKNSSLQQQIVRGQHWFPPEKGNPVGTGQHSAKHWYLKNVWVYTWQPFAQFGTLCDIKTTKCPKCKITGKLQSKEFDFRTGFMADKPVFLHHRRVLCGACNKSTSEIDPSFLANLPTRVSDTLEFVTTVRGPAVHTSLMYSFVNLLTKGIMFGAFVNMINEVYAVRHTVDHLSFISSVFDVCRLNGTGTLDPNNFEVFCPIFSDTSGYCFPRITKAVLKAVVFTFAGGFEAYAQASVQTRCDESCERDDTHKFSKAIHVHGRKGKVFMGSTTIMSGQGFCNLSRLRYTKSHSEIRPTLQQWRLVRENDGVAELLRCASDDPRAIGREMEYLYPSLKKNVVPRRQPTPNLPRASIRNENFLLVETCEEANNVASALLDYLDRNHGAATDGTVWVGVDKEWNFHDGTTALSRVLTLSIPNNKVYIFHLSPCMGATASDKFPSLLRLLLEDKRLRAVGVNVGGDLTRLRNLGVNMHYRLELRELSKHLSPGESAGLSALSERHLNVFVDKTCQTDDWSIAPMMVQNQEYCALDAVLHRILGKRMYEKAKANQLLVDGTNPESADFATGATVEYVSRKRIIAKGVITSIGNEHGLSRQWGSMHVGSGKATVRLSHVFVPGERPQFDYEDPQDEQRSWLRSNVSMGDIFLGHENGTMIGPELCFRTKSLRTNLPVVEEASCTHHDLLELEDVEHVIETSMRSEEARASESMDVEMASSGLEHHQDAREEDQSEDEDALQAEEDQYDDDYADILEILDSSDDDPNTNELDDAVLSRMKGDLWHDYHSIPLPRDNPIKSLVLAMVIHATTEFATEDFEFMLNYLQKLEIDDWRQHFRFNREFWRRRVRLLVAKAGDHAARLRLVRNKVKSSPSLLKHCTVKLDAWFDKLEKNAMDGIYEGLIDVQGYIPGRVDSNGFQLWYRSNGSSVRCENFHNILKSALGHYGIGAKSAHYVMVLLAFRYNVNTGIRRLGEHNFGHIYLHLIDEIQDKYHALFGVKLFPRHRNLSHFKSIPNFIAIGIGALSFDADFVCQGPPMASLKGDLRFMAERMNVKCAPMPVGTADEYRIFSIFVLHNPKMTDAKFRVLGKEFLAKTDGKTVFPKLPSMLKSHYKQWKKNQVIRQVEREAKQIVDATLEQLQRPQPTPATRNPRLAGRDDVDGNRPAENWVPRVVAPGQQRYIAAIPKKRPPGKMDYACFYEGYCGAFASECGGRKRGQCKFINNGTIKIPEDALEFQRVKDQARKVRTNKEKQEKRKRLKEESSLT